MRTTHPTAGSPPAPDRAETDPITEDLHVRNYDVERTYDLGVVVRDGAGETVWNNHYRLKPGQSRSEPDAIEAGCYEVVATIGPFSETAGTCCVGSEPSHTALVEVGNGVVSVSEGLYR